MTDAAAEKAIKAEYKELKSAINAAPGDFNTVKRLTDIFTPLVHFAGFTADKLAQIQIAGLAADKIAQASTVASAAGTAAGPFIPAVSAALGTLTLLTTGVTLWKGLGFKSRSDETVRSYKTQFNRAARGYLATQIVSTASMAASALTYGVGEHFGLGAANGSPVQLAIGTTLGVIGAIAGWKAHANAAKLSVYSTAIRNAKNTAVPASAAPAEPSVPTVA
jgi:hypothetical protein